MSGSSELEVCFVTEEIHEIARSTFQHLAGRLVRLNNYDHVSVDLFQKLKIVQNNSQLSRFKKPTPKICVACCTYLDKVQPEMHSTNKRKYSTKSPEATVSDTATSFDKLLHEIKTRDFTEDEMNILMNAVGERMAPLVHKHVSDLNKKHLENRLEDMAKMTYQSYWKNTLAPLKHIFLGLIDGMR